MKREYIKPESKYLTVNGQVVMTDGGNELGGGSPLSNDAIFEEEKEGSSSSSVWKWME